MTRIIAGSARGRRLSVPEGDVTRPTSDRVREALFSTVRSMTDLDGIAVLDLYAGSGGLGLEALSRGASRATFVERDRRALRCLRANIATTGVEAARVLAGDVLRVLSTAAPAPHDVVLLDPPYGLDPASLVDALRRAVERGWVADEAIVVCERPTRAPEPAWPRGLERVARRPYGETCLWYLRRFCEHDRSSPYDAS